MHFELQLRYRWFKCNVIYLITFISCKWWQDCWILWVVQDNKFMKVSRG